MEVLAIIILPHKHYLYSKLGFPGGPDLSPWFHKSGTKNHILNLISTM